MDNVTKLLGKRIRSIRISLGINQEELAFKAGISAAHLGQIERGLKSPTITTIDKIAKALNITLPILFSFDIISQPAYPPRLNKIYSYISDLDDTELSEITKIIKSIIRLKNK